MISFIYISRNCKLIHKTESKWLVAHIRGRGDRRDYKSQPGGAPPGNLDNEINDYSIGL